MAWPGGLRQRRVYPRRLRIENAIATTVAHRNDAPVQKSIFVIESLQAQAAWFTNLSGNDFGDAGVLASGRFGPGAANRKLTSFVLYQSAN
jgi:hypothetical protein